MSADSVRLHPAGVVGGVIYSSCGLGQIIGVVGGLIVLIMALAKKILAWGANTSTDAGKQRAARLHNEAKLALCSAGILALGAIPIVGGVVAYCVAMKSGLLTSK